MSSITKLDFLLAILLYRLNKDAKPAHHTRHSAGPTTEEDLEAEGLTLLVPQIQHTVDIVRQGTSKLIAETMGKIV